MSPAPETLPSWQTQRYQHELQLRNAHLAAMRYYQAQEQARHRQQTELPSYVLESMRDLSVDTADSHNRPTFLHKVYIIRCTHCEAFLTDRGMRAILLLRPQIVLFSTDAAPVNVGPLYSGTNQPAAVELQERTCDCASQALGCLGCGSAVGYHIITPCEKCIGSSQDSGRSANGHRYVFHCGEVMAEERYWQPGEMDAAAFSMLWARGRTRHRAPSFGKATQPPSTSDEEGSASPTVALSTTTDNCCLSTPHLGGQVYWAHLHSSGEFQPPVDPQARSMPAPIAGR